MADRDLAKLIVLTPSCKNGLDGKRDGHHVGSALTEGLRLFDEVQPTTVTSNNALVHTPVCADAYPVLAHMHARTHAHTHTNQYAPCGWCYKLIVTSGLAATLTMLRVYLEPAPKETFFQIGCWIS